MDIIRFKGGLGNQMFQYAFSEALRMKKEINVCGDKTFYFEHPELRKFELFDAFPKITISFDTQNQFDKKRRQWENIKQSKEALNAYYENLGSVFFYVEKEPFVYDETVFKTGECVYVGYWQSFKYFNKYKHDIVSKFQFSDINQEVKSLGDMFQQQKYCSVHIRLGDYVDASDTYGGICTREYYYNAMQLVKKKIPGVKFVVFSDDIKGACELLNGAFEMQVVSDNMRKHSWDDMYLMTRCTANIIANSSFSWWGAYLNSNNSNIIIAPKKWVHNHEKTEIICPEWIVL